MLETITKISYSIAMLLEMKKKKKTLQMSWFQIYNQQIINFFKELLINGM